MGEAQKGGLVLSVTTGGKTTLFGKVHSNSEANSGRDVFIFIFD